MNDLQLVERKKLINSQIHDLTLKNLKYGNEIISEYNTNLFDLEKSLKYRLNSIIFHAKEIEFQINNVNKYLDDQINFHLRSEDIIKYNNETSNFTEILLYLFDDQIFSSASFFDYLAKLFTVIFSKEFSRYDWKKFIKEINNNTISCEEKILKLLNEENGKFIKPLSQHRSQIIHNLMDMSNPRETVNWNQNSGLTKNLNPSVPKFFEEEFIDFKILNENNQLSLIDASNWLLHNTLDSVERILITISE
ncbi:hypothetical protein LPTSP2_39160 [Leptospira ellinghausenii]|uniref:Cthe-2314-like HEPN domain-containing protein n=1 Tax=Leptospira ellinghausenii TaxID=1917822 RepID=A0A2P2DIW7_9LEPT|nr:hypothetical protein [Leptospira ellinghausenii]GBF44613.1 hypothetical protein LPTSP2_39160 [Leptospira ellinghausenii]